MRTLRQAIQTKYLNPTNTRGARIKATCCAKSVTLSWRHELSPEKNHRRIANELRDRLGWKGDLVMGQLKDGTYVHVFAERETE